MNKNIFLFSYYLITNKVQHFYRFFPKNNLFGKNSSFINFGYWKKNGDYDSSSQQLALMLAHYCVLQSNQKVISVGCGFGDELILWKEHCQLDTIIGINSDYQQLRTACSLKKGLDVSVCQANATALSFLPNTLDRVMALESAFHFNTREQFFKEANTVLKSGGILSLADIILSDEKFNILQRGILMIIYRIFKVPVKNRQTWEEYKQSLQQTGFMDIEKKDITRRAIQGFAIYTIRHKVFKNKIVSIAWRLLKAFFPKKYPFSYVIVRAIKPVNTT